jgi:hypothetical protein
MTKTIKGATVFVEADYANRTEVLYYGGPHRPWHADPARAMRYTRRGADRIHTQLANMPKLALVALVGLPNEEPISRVAVGWEAVVTHIDKLVASHALWLSGDGGERLLASGADLRGADLRGADLRGADLRGADLRGADLREADLRGADLRGADLRGADLRGADLREADLRGADLSFVDFRNVFLKGANLSNTNTHGIIV